jgi:hypothetical protein
VDGASRPLAEQWVPAAAFAARERINPRTLLYWRWRLRTDGAAALPNPTRGAPFVELVVPKLPREAPACLEIVLPAGYRVRLGDAVVADTLRAVLDVLETRG